MNLLKSLFRPRRGAESMFRYISAMLHLWLGLLSSGVILVVCLTGSIYAFKTPVANWMNRRVANVSPSATSPLSPGHIVEGIQGNGGVVHAITLPDDDTKSWIISYADGLTQSARTVYVDPYTGIELGEGSDASAPFFSVVLSLHKTLLMNRVGKQVVGASVLVFVAMLLTGLVLWWPRNKKALRDGLSIKWRYPWLRVVRDLHNTLGFYSLVLLLFIALTGLYVAYPWVKNGIIVMLGGQSVTSVSVHASDASEPSGDFAGLLQQMLDKQAEQTSMGNAAPIGIDSVLWLARQQLGYSGHTVVRFPDEHDPRYTITCINDHNWLGVRMPDVLSLDKRGDVKSLDRFADKPLHKQFMALSLPLHTGEFMGLPGIILYALASLIGCSLPVTGFLLWWKKARISGR